MIIEFYHIDAFEVPNYEPVWRSLKEMGVDARIVGVPPKQNAAGEWFDYERFKTYCTEKAIPFTTQADPNAAIAITTQNANILRDYDCPRVRIMYGPIVYPEAWGLQKHAVQPFDGLLTHSQFYADFYSRWLSPEKLPVVGYPRYDDFFAGKLNRANIRARWGVNDSRPVLVFLPTWGDNTAFDKFLPSLLQLTNQFQIILRPHHCTLRFEPERMKLLKASGLLILDNAFDLAEIYAGADVILSDVRSGGLFEAVLCDIPTVGMVVNANEISGWLSQASIHQIISLCSEPSQLEAKINEALILPSQAYHRKLWAEERSAYRDGSAGKQAAKALLKLAESIKKPITVSKQNAWQHFNGLIYVAINRTNLNVN